MQLKRVADFIIRNLISGDTSMFSHADSIGCEQSIANLLDGVLIIDVVDSSVDRDRFILISAALEGKQANEGNILRLGTGYGKRCVGRQNRRICLLQHLFAFICHGSGGKPDNARNTHDRLIRVRRNIGVGMARQRSTKKKCQTQ